MFSIFKLHTPPLPAAATVPAPLSSEALCEQVLGWVHGLSAAQLAAQTAGWGAGEWEAARWTVQVHGLGPLLCQRLQGSAAWHCLAPTLQRFLVEQYELNGQRLRAMLADLEEILWRADAAGLAVMPLKGSVIACHFCDDPALRPMADLDLLVQPQDEPRVAALLRAMGYRPTEETPRHRSFSRQPPRDGSFVQGEHPDNPRGVELHTIAEEQFWGIRYDVTGRLWAGARRAHFGAAPGWLPQPAALLEHLLIHASLDMVDGKVRLVRLRDLALVGQTMDAAAWRDLLHAGHRRGEERLLLAPLVVAERYLGPFVPPDVRAALAEGTPAALRAFAARVTLYHLSFCNPLALSLRERLSWHRPGRERLRAVRHRLLPSPRALQQLHPTLAGPARVPRAYLLYHAHLLEGLRRRLLRRPRLPWLSRSRGGRAR